jgi:hypothetical protein
MTVAGSPPCDGENLLVGIGDDVENLTRLETSQSAADAVHGAIAADVPTSQQVEL